MYQVLYRKWRPRSFSDVVGQPHVTTTLANELASGRLSHAYLFTGSRGTGKTSCAKILSKAVNCLNPVNGNPCNECEICKGIDSGAVLDVVEIDAASNNGVDNIRDLRDEANFTPVKAKYRVYIIDEVHMLSAGAFNALLKTLEEPPSYVLFILATTEVHKLPATILSRCQRFDFKRIPPEDIAGRLQTVATAEGLTLEDDAALLIARIADGALRDALSLLDLCSANVKMITAALVSDAAGLADKEYLFELTGCMNTNDSSSALELLNELHNSSCDMERLCSELINHLRSLMIVKTVKSASSLLICTEEDFKRLKQQSDAFTLEEILHSLSLLEETFANLHRGVNKRIEMEMALIRLCSVNLNDSHSALLNRIASLEAALLNGSFTKNSENITIQAPAVSKPLSELAGKVISKSSIEDEKTSPINETLPAEVHVEQEGSEKPFDSWPEVLSNLNSTNKPLVGLLAGSRAVLNGDILLIKSDNLALERFMENLVFTNDLKKAVLNITGKEYKVKVYKKIQQQQSSDEDDKFSSLLDKIAQLQNDD